MKLLKDAASQYEDVCSENSNILRLHYMHMCRIEIFLYRTLEYAHVYGEHFTVQQVTIWTRVR